jgi:putative ABC transport system permease protein
MGDEATEIVIKTSENTSFDVLNQKLDPLLKSRGLESNTWRDVSAFFVGVMEKQNGVVFALCLIFYCIVISSITNTMILTLFERKKEIGTMMAIGIKSRHVIQLIIMESTIIGFIGSLLGILISTLLIVSLNMVGLSYKPPAGASSVTIYPLINQPFMLLSFVLGVVSAIIGSIYPARKVLQVNPVDALRTI